MYQNPLNTPSWRPRDYHRLSSVRFLRCVVAVDISDPDERLAYHGLLFPDQNRCVPLGCGGRRMLVIGPMVRRLVSVQGSHS
jgi:hypothetical protein